MTGSQQNPTGSLSLSDDVTGRGCAQDAILSDQHLLDSVGSSDLRAQLHDLRVPVPAISSDNEEAILDPLGDREQDRGHKGLRVVLFLEDDNLLAEARAIRVSQELCGMGAASLRSRLLVLERSESNSLDRHDCSWTGMTVECGMWNTGGLTFAGQKDKRYREERRTCGSGGVEVWWCGGVVLGRWPTPVQEGGAAENRKRWEMRGPWGPRG